LIHQMPLPSGLSKTPLIAFGFLTVPFAIMFHPGSAVLNYDTEWA
jgi:hypothetical protein